MKRKIRKLLRDPRQFFVDLYLKRFRGVARLAPKRKEGFGRYTVVSAVYNVAPYLEQFIKSLVDQRLDFTTNIFLVLVDDGSTDDSLEIIERWRKRFPENIKCIQKENGGQASARNLGLEYVATEWVTFIDPDDFVDINYFLDVDVFMKRNHAKRVAMVSCNLIFFYEERGAFSDTHPLRYRFSKGDCVFRFDDLGKGIQLSASSAFFRSAILRRNGILFDLRVRPNFEDAHFIGCYLAVLDDGGVGFAAKPRYYYRKRSDGSSTLDTAWGKHGLYDEVLRYGCLDILNRFAARYGQVPRHIQRTVLYHLIWYIKRIVNKPESIAFLSHEQRKVFLHLMAEVFSHIDALTIRDFELAGCWFFHKVGMLAAFKNADPALQIVYIEDYDAVGLQVLIRYFVREPGLEVFQLDGVDTLPVYAKTGLHDFCGLTFTHERRIWLPLVDGSRDAVLTARIDGVTATLSLAKKHHTNGLRVSHIRIFFSSKDLDRRSDVGERNLWLMMDRDSQADDNAEHLYRYVQRVHPEQPICFVLRRESHDWGRLAQEGFKLLAYGSRAHEEALRSCKKIISSHADRYVVDYFGDGSLGSKQFVFLQHGVTKDDLSAWLNTKPRIDCFVTASEREYLSIAGDNNRYKFTRKEVVLTGFPRHDALLQAGREPERLILVMPTWRKYLLGESLGGNQRELVDDFMETEYARAWRSFLVDPALIELARRYGCRVVFFPHANIQPYLSSFELPAEIEVLSHANGSIQDLFIRSALIVTDYSSVALEMAYLGRSIVYWQFDEDEFFKGDHVFQKGYFDYRRDGFGPIVTREDELIEEVRGILDRDMQPSAGYLQRMEDFFPFRDGRCCERVYDAICSLDRPRAPGPQRSRIVHEAARFAVRARNWDLAEGRYRQLLDQCIGDLEPAVAFEAKVQFAEALRHRGKLGEAMSVVSELENEGSLADRSVDVRSLVACKARICMDKHEFELADRYWKTYEDWPSTDAWLKRMCAAEVGDEAWETGLGEIVDCAVEHVAVAALSALESKDWKRLAGLTSEMDLISLPPGTKLLVVRAWRELGDVEQARRALASYVESRGKDRESILEEARIAHVACCWDDVLTGLDEAYPEGITSMPATDLGRRIDALRNLGRRQIAEDELNLTARGRPSSQQILRMQAELALEDRNWKKAAELWGRLHEITGSAHYGLARALRYGGRTEEALSLLRNSGLTPPSGLQELQLLAELAQLQGEYELAAECWHTVLSDYAADAPDCAWERLEFLTLVQKLDAEQIMHGAGRHRLSPNEHRSFDLKS